MSSQSTQESEPPPDEVVREPLAMKNAPGRWVLTPEGTIESEGFFASRAETTEAAKRFIDEMLAAPKVGDTEQ